MRRIIFVEVNTHEVARFKAIMIALCLTHTKVGVGPTNSTDVFKCWVPPWPLHVQLGDDPNKLTALRFADGIVYFNTFDIRDIPKVN